MFILCGIIVLSCKHTEKDSSKIVHYLNSADEPLQEFPPYSNVEIIKLETSPSCLLTNIKRIEMNDSLIFISEYDNLYIFTRKGDFVTKVGAKGEGPNEYIVLSTFYVDNDKRQITIIDEFKNVLLNYDFTGEYISTVSMPQKTFEACFYAMLAVNNKVLSYNMMSMNDTKACTLFDLKTKTSERYFSYQPITVGNYLYSFSWHPMAKIGNDIDFIMPLCDTIFTYLAETSSFQPKYVIETPQKMASKNQIREKTPDYIEDMCKLAEQGFFTGFTGIFETDKAVLLEYRTQGVVVGYFLFDKKSRTGNYYWGMSGSEKDALPFFPIIYSYKNEFVGYADAGFLLTLKNIKDKKILECFKDLKEDDNPCLIMYKFE